MLKFVKGRNVLTSLLLVILLTLTPAAAIALPNHGTGTESNPYLISDCEDLQSMEDDLDAHYALISNIYCSGFGGVSGFDPVGDNGARFTGALDGNGFEIHNLTINRSGTNNVGLFGHTDGSGTIENLGLVDPDISGNEYVGSIAAVLAGSDGLIRNSFVQGGTVEAAGSYVGGISAGVTSGATIENSYATAAIEGGSSGGLAGYQSSGNFTNSFWDAETSGEEASAGGTGRTTLQMKSESTFTDAGWDFSEVWDLDEEGEINEGYPFIRRQVMISTAAPAQDHCDNGSTTYTWDGEGLVRPVVATMFVDGEEIVDPHNPEDGSIGAVICPMTEDARKTSLVVVYNDGGNYSQDLTNAETPDGNPITADSVIEINMGTMGELSEFYSFSLVHGVVSEWENINLTTEDALINFTFSPAQTPIVDYMADGAQFCSATPPTCDVEKSAIDILSASLDMDFDQEGGFTEMTGAYFGLVNAVSGYVTNQEGTISATLGAPHFMADGETERVGSMRAFLPELVVQNVWGVSSSDITAGSLVVNRLEDEEVTVDDPPFSVEQVDNGIIVSLSDITFSTPTYTFESTARLGTAGDLESSQEELAATGGSRNIAVLVALFAISVPLGFLFKNKLSIERKGN